MRLLSSVIPLLLLPGPQPQRAPRMVAITIDDLPAAVAVSVSTGWASVTERLLATLRRHEVPAVGFVNERKLYVNDVLDSGRVALLEAWLEAGQELGNH